MACNAGPAVTAGVSEQSVPSYRCLLSGIQDTEGMLPGAQPAPPSAVGSGQGQKDEADGLMSRLSFTVSGVLPHGIPLNPGVVPEERHPWR